MTRAILAAVVALASLVAGGATVRADAALTAWQRSDAPIFEGQYFASDPTVVASADGGGYRMVYTCLTWLGDAFDPETARSAICEATSDDGLAWENVPAKGPFEGVVLRGREGSWDQYLEAPFLLSWKGADLLYASGYRHEGDPAQGFPAALEVARSVDGGPFAWVSDEPTLAPTPGWYDADAVYSPSIVVDHENDRLVMVYAGHCYGECDHRPGVTLLAATSTDGMTWEKQPEPLLTAMPDELRWTRDGVAEPGLVEAPDGTWRLLFTALIDDERAIGLASSPGPLGPWTPEPEPVLLADRDYGGEVQVLAPHVLIEGDVARMWYLSYSQAEGEDYRVGYAEASLEVPGLRFRVPGRRRCEGRCP